MLRRFPFLSMIEIEFVVVIGIYIAIMLAPALHSSAAVFATNAVVVIFSLLGILSEPDRSYSARKMVYLYVFFFMGLAPLMQFKTGAQTVGGYIIAESTYVKVNLIMAGVLVLFEVSYRFFYTHILRPFMRPRPAVEAVSEKKKRLWRNLMLGFGILSVVLTVAYFHAEPIRLLVRGLSRNEFGFTLERTSDIYLQFALNWIVRPLSALCCINYLAMGKNRTYKALLLCLMLIAYFPTSLERVRAAVFYIALLIMLLPSLRFRNRFALIFVAGFLIVFPLLENFRIWSDKGFDWPEFNIHMFDSMHYDSYQSFAFAFQNGFVDFTGQVSEFFLFWIPRIFWPTKPMNSGYRIAHTYDLDYDFIAMNFWGEGYILCGIVGVILFTFLLAWIVSKMDYTYYETFAGSTRNLFAPFYLLFLGLIFFCLRGDIIGGLIETITILGLNYLVYRLSLYLLRTNQA